MSDKRYQVFVSSTYKDLKNERGEIAQTLMTMGCIPAGMEFFTAMDEDTFEFIKTVIDLSDYFLLIIANRYGSPAPDGLSYTEKEYDYAISKGLKIVALIHEKPETLPFDQSEETVVARKKLDAFREKVKGRGTRIVKFWTKPEELPGHVALSVQAVINRHPATGWVRGDQVASKELLTRLDQLNQLNSAFQRDIYELEGRVKELESGPLVKDLAGLDEGIDLRCSIVGQFGPRWFDVPATWRYLFASLGPYLLEYKGDREVKRILTDLVPNLAGTVYPGLEIADQCFQTIKLQFMALGVVEIAKGGNGSSWKLSPSGRRLLLELRTFKSGPDGRGWLPSDAPPLVVGPGP